MLCEARHVKVGCMAVAKNRKLARLDHLSDRDDQAIGAKMGMRMSSLQTLVGF
jgi:hypothetical protein